MALPPLLPACAAEGNGMFALVFAGCGAIVINTISGGQVTHSDVGLVFGLVVATMIYATGHLSGAHLNPAVTLGFVLARHFPVRRMAGYWLAQLTGAIAAALGLRLLFGDVAHLGATVGLCALFVGPTSGASMNPARSLGPAPVSAAWTVHWINLTAPSLGAALAGLSHRWLGFAGCV